MTTARKRLLFGLAALAALVVVAGLLSLTWAYRLRPRAREKAIELLEERFDEVRLESLSLQVQPGFLLFPRVTATGKGLSLGLPNRAEDGVPPFIAMGAIEAEVELFGLFRDPIRIRSLRLDRLAIQIPPKRESSEGESKKELPPPIVVEDLVADGAVLRILPRDPAKEPLQFDLHELSVKSAGLGEPMRFEAILENPKPPGQIRTKGEFGPLSLYDAGASPVSGNYVFAEADLSVFKGIGGRLYSEGRFGGVLERIEVSGFTETPDFQLTSAGNPIELRTAFEALVDGTNGDTLLRPVDAVLAGSSGSTAKGGVAKQPGTAGKTVCLDAEGSRGRIEDFLRLAMSSEPPFMTGEVRFRTLILIPPGELDVVEKLLLDGEFWIDSALFPRREIQERIDKLSQTASGVSVLGEERVASAMRASFRLEGGVMYISYISFRVPGADVRLKGSYGLVSEKIDFRGELFMDAKVSETTTGLKSFFLKLVDPLFEKRGAGAVIPIRIGGTADAPSFGLDVGRVFSREEVARLPKAGGEWSKTIPTCSGMRDADSD